MIKKVLIVFSLSFLLQLILISCCPDPAFYYFKIKDIQSAHSQFENQLQDSASVTQEEYRLRINISEETYAQSLVPKIYINQALALSCEENFVGLDSRIESFVITSNQDIYNTPAGNPLDYSNFRVHTNGFDADMGLAVDEWLYNINNSGYLFNLSWYFQLSEPSDSDSYMKFTINIIQEDGTDFETQTASVKLIP